MAEWPEGAVAMREVLGYIPGQGELKNIWGRGKLSDCISFRRAVKRQRFHTLKKCTIQSQIQHNNNSLQSLSTLELYLGPF